MSTPAPVPDRLRDALADRYHLEREAGAGGMATVYLATDVRHERKVAIKVLRPELAAVLGAERFIHEIKTTARLQHPHILPLHDSGTADGFLYYVMPFLAGETLRDRLDRETQLSVEESVGIATEVADALHYAHRQGVIHRDIKPENILLNDGRVMVVDFGIALAVSAAAGGRMTETGMSLGTPHYMSPEQATAERDLTPRTDIYSLGTVLYEMLTGEPPHTGSSAQAIVLKIVTDRARSVSDLRRSVPPNVAAAVAKAIEKLPADRFTSAADFASALANPAFRYGEATTGAPAAWSRSGLWNPLSAAMTMLAVVLAALAMWPGDVPESPAAMVTPVALPEAQRPAGILETSADGTLLVYEGAPGEAAPLLAFRRDAGVSLPIPGTEGGVGPALRLDGEELAFIAEDAIRLVSTGGGTPRTVLTHPGVCCLRWDEAGAFIYFTEADGTLSRVRAAGGGLERVVAVDRDAGDAQNGWFASLPGGTHGLYQASGPLDANARIMLVELASGNVSEVVPGAYPRFSNGDLVYSMIESSSLPVLMTVPFDPDRLTTTGPSRRIAEGLALIGPGPWRMNPSPVAVSQRGTLWYSTGANSLRMPVWVARDGSSEPLDPTWIGQYYSLTLSPDGTRLLADEGIGSCCIFVKEIPLGPLTRITVPDAITVYRASWTSGGDSIVFSAVFDALSTEIDVYIAPADGSGQPVSLGATGPHAVVSPDGRWVVTRSPDVGDRRASLFALPRAGGAPWPLVDSDSTEIQPAFSPDGRFLAYASDISGRFEVYVRPFPDADGWVRQISISGGTSPVWARGGRELFYVSQARELVSARIDTSSGFTVESRAALFSAAGYSVDPYSVNYDVAPDDQRFVMLRTLESASEERLVVVDGFTGMGR
jgi:eukaryotic-like serine/threonine-protein kinase